jgi:hypothetical protein
MTISRNRRRAPSDVEGMKTPIALFTALPASLLLFLLAPPVAAQEPPRFGRRGQVVLTDANSAGISWTSYDSSNASILSVGLSPAAHYFVADHLSLGLSLSFSYRDSKGYGADGSLVDSTSTLAGGGATLGYDVPLGGALSVWPRGEVGFEWTRVAQTLVSGASLSTAGSPLGYPTTTKLGPYVDLYVPLVLQAAPHFFLGAGPSLFHEFGNAQGGPNVGGQRTTFGGTFMIGGWLGGAGGDAGPSAGAPAEGDAAPRPVRRFGDQGVFSLGSDISVAASHTDYAGTSSSTTSATFSPGFDYFVSDHFSMGIGVTASYGSASGTDPTTGGAVSSSRTGFGIAPRIGANVPIGASLSFYPRVSLGYGYSKDTETSSAGQNSPSEEYGWFGLYAPLLVHAAPHFYVGFGPSATTDISHSFAYPGGSVSNKGTSFGAGLTVGGWLL